MAETLRPSFGLLNDPSSAQGSDLSIPRSLSLPRDRGMSATFHPMQGLLPELPSAQASAASIDQALTLLLADETEAGLRWGAAALERETTCDALTVTSQLLERMGRKRAAIEGLEAAVRRAVESGDLPIAVAAIDQLRTLGADVREPFSQVADAFCEESPRLEGATPPLLPHFDDFQPLSSFLSGPTLASKASQIVEAATRIDDEMSGGGLSPVARLPLFSALSRDALLDLLGAFEVITVPAGHRVIETGEHGTTAYVVARGELEVSRRVAEGKPPVVLARLGSGAFFGELALLSDMPRAASVVAVRPSILLVAERGALNAVSQRHPEVGLELAAHCRRRLVTNLGRTSPVLAYLPPTDRALLIDRFMTRIFRKGERFASQGQEVEGLHLVASGTVAIVTDDGSERVTLATLGAGETIGEVELVLRRKANADAIALEPTATLFLSRENFSALVEDHPALVHGLYVSALRRDGETSQALAAAVTSDYVLDEGDYELNDSDHTVDEVLEETVAALPPGLPSDLSLLVTDYVREMAEPAHDAPEMVAETVGLAVMVPGPAEASLGNGGRVARSGPPIVPLSPFAASPSASPSPNPTANEPRPAAMGAPSPTSTAPASAPSSDSWQAPPVPAGDTSRDSGNLPPKPPKPSGPPALPFVPAAATVTPKGTSVAPASSIAPTITSVLPAPRARARRELPPVAIAAMFALVGVIAGSVVAQFGKHGDSAASGSGGVAPEVVAPAEIPTAPATPTEVPAAATTATPTTSEAQAIPDKAPLAPTKLRARPISPVGPPGAVITRDAPRPPAPAVAAATLPSEARPATSAAAAQLDPKAAKTQTKSPDEFGGGRE
jgi:CRP-like cAMP-binding protein